MLQGSLTCYSLVALGVAILSSFEERICFVKEKHSAPSGS